MPDKQDQRKLGTILVERGLITAPQLEEALTEQRASNRFIGEVLVNRGAASEEQIAQALSDQLGLAFVDVSLMALEPKAVKAAPKELCDKYNVVPLFIVGDTLTLAMANPLDVAAIDQIQSTCGLRIKPVFACPTAIRIALERKTRPQAQEGAGFSLAFAREQAVSREQIDFLKQAASLAPVVNMVNSLISRAVEMSASDIHLEPQKDIFQCRYRIDGVLYSSSQIPQGEQAAVISRIKIMANMDIAEKRLPQDGRVQMYVAGRDVDLRISTFPVIYGENVVIRILDRSGGILKLEQLGLSKDILAEFFPLIHRPHGIILVTGPTGSGKTTTLYAALSQINSQEKNIITLEDPVEYEIPQVRQSQVNVKAGLTFAGGLRAIVRQDPDIIMIGEIRDKETADIAIHAALTGHLVFSTLHTNDAPQAAIRLIDMGVEPFLVASSIIGILAQRLVRCLCPHCKQEYSPAHDLLKQLGLHSERNNAITQRRLACRQAGNHVFYKEAGCKQCQQRGFTGRTGIYELLIPDDTIRELISRKASATVLKEQALKYGMKTLREAGLDKVVEGLTSVAELLRVTEEA